MSRGDFAPGKIPPAVRNTLIATIETREVQDVIAPEDVSVVENLDGNYESRREYCRISASRPCAPALTSSGASAGSTKSVDHAG